MDSHDVSSGFLHLQSCMLFPVWCSAIVHTDWQSNALTPSICSIVTSIMDVMSYCYICGCNVWYLYCYVQDTYWNCPCSSKLTRNMVRSPHLWLSCRHPVLIYTTISVIALQWSPIACKWDQPHYLTCVSINRPFLLGFCTCASILRVSVGHMLCLPW